MDLIKKEQRPVFYFLLLILAIFLTIFISRKNYEFVMYVGVIIFFMAVIMLTNHRVSYPLPVLWGLAIWALLHMSGGGIFINGKKLYELTLFSIVGPPYNIFKYDQFVHIVGFGVATLLMYYLLKPLLQKNLKKWATLSIVVIMAGLGIGALNELIEFAATVLVPETGVGGYENTSLDMVADLIGAVMAMMIIHWKEKKHKRMK